MIDWASLTLPQAFAAGDAVRDLHHDLLKVLNSSVGQDAFEGVHVAAQLISNERDRFTDDLARRTAQLEALVEEQRRKP